ncbi:MAG: hypothetical protein ISR76_03280 [Planctomycetes bacterium]|nr:hypothetical protein [Planctomycetota bacterium]
MMKTLLTIATTLLLLASAAPASAALVAGNNDLIWDANNTVNGVKLVAKYKESPDNGLIDQSLEVELNNAPPNTLVYIRAGAWDMGSMTTDAFGRAATRFDRFGVTPDPAGRPAGPRLETGDMIRVHRGVQAIEAPLVPRP